MTFRALSCYAVVLDAVVTWWTVNALINHGGAGRSSVLSVRTADWQRCATRAVMTKLTLVLYIVRRTSTKAAPVAGVASTFDFTIITPLGVGT